MSDRLDIGARSYLYVPGNRPDLFAKAIRGHADAVVLDLEDAVSDSHKQEARDTVVDLLTESEVTKDVWVRVNGPRSEHHHADLLAVKGLNLAGIRLPEVEQPLEVIDAARQLRSAGARPPRLSLLIESAKGLEAMSELADADPAVIGLALGEADLIHDLGVEAEMGLLYARSRCVCVSRAAGLLPPTQSVFVDLSSVEGLRESTLSGRQLGFYGRSVIHPSQIDVVNEAFTPTSNQVKEARAVLESLGTAAIEGQGGTVRKGRFVDGPALKSAQRVLSIAEHFGVTA